MIKRLIGTLIFFIGLGMAGPPFLDFILDPNYRYAPDRVPGLLVLSTFGGAMAVIGIWVLVASFRRKA